ncbi:MAG: hypothetical protein J6A37_09495 [Oscillospiraceae bacterium]|nr:hypothetical protein [Oscillospiraceae bacterium]
MILSLAPYNREIWWLIFIPLIFLVTSYFKFKPVSLFEKHKYSPDKQPTKKMCRMIEKAYELHRKENSDRKPVEEELQPTGNIILNKKKFIDGMTALIDSTGMTRAEYDSDYYSGELFKCMSAMMNISRSYVTYSDIHGNQHIISTKKIRCVYPYIENTNMYSYGLLMTVMQKFYIIIVTEEFTYKFAISQYMDRPVMDAFRRLIPYLHYECDLYSYPFSADHTE